MCSLTQAYHQVTAGCLNGSWVTPKGAYSLPFAANATNSTLRADFSFLEKDYDLSTKKAACVVAILRTDYNSTSGQFTNAGQTYPSAEVYICPWWSRSLTPTGTFVKKISINRLVSRLFTDVACSPEVPTTCWPTYTFVSLKNRTVNPNLNLNRFTQFAAESDPLLLPMHIVAVQAGFRFYTGRGSFQFGEVAIYNRTETETLGSSGLWSSFANVASLPNIGLVFQMASLIRTVDDLSYYRYHRTSYDLSLSQTSQLCANLTRARWMMPQLAPLYEEFRVSYSPLQPPPATQNTPAKFRAADRNVNFLAQTEHFWLCLVPLSLLGFLLLHLLHRALRRFECTARLSRVLIRFRWFGFLFVSLIGEHVQFLSFRCFSQTYELLPRSAIELLNLVLCYTVLFVVVFYAVASLFVLAECVRPGRRHLVLGMKYTLRTFMHVTTLAVVRFFSGAINSLLHGESVIQAGILLALQVLFVSLTLSNCRIYKQKILWAFHLCEGGLRIALQVLLLH